MAEREVMFMAAVQGDSKSSFTAPATCWGCHSRLLQSTGWYQLTLFACVCLRKTVLGKKGTCRLCIGLEVTCPQSENTKAVEIPMKYICSRHGIAVVCPGLTWIKFF